MRGRIEAREYKPVRVFWELTAGCNLRCIHCHSSASSLLSPEDLSHTACRKVIEEIAEFAPLTLVIGGGEPLWRRDVFDLARYATEKNLQVALATNGTLVDEAMAQRIYDAGITRVAISLDGRDATTHDTFRGHRGAFAAAVRGVGLLRGLGVATEISTTVSRHNAHELPDILKLARDLRVRAFHMFLFEPVGCGLRIQDDNAIRGEEAEKILEWFYHSSLESDLELKATCAPHYRRIVYQKQGGAPDSATARKKAEAEGCPAGRAVCFISHRGDVFPCGSLRVSAGNLTESGFREIWEHAKVFQDLRDTRNLEGNCGICEYNDICIGCRAAAYRATGNYLAEEPDCTHEPRELNAEHNTRPTV